MFHSTWAYSQDSKHPGFANYSCSQNVMFDEIIGTTEMVMDAYHFDILIRAALPYKMPGHRQSETQ